MTIVATFKKYFSIRQCMDDSFFKGKMTSDPSLRELQTAIDNFYLPLKEMAKKYGLQWKVQIGFGKGNATTDQYVALIPQGQRVSEGIFFCICFDHFGKGCVFGAMSAMKKMPQIGLPVIQRAIFIPDADPIYAWQMIPPNKVDIRKWNNAFFYFQELDVDGITKSPAVSEKIFFDCFEKSVELIKKHISAQ